MNKQDVLDLISEMPDELDIEELVYRLSVLRKLELAEEDFREGRLIPHEDVVREMDEWPGRLTSEVNG